MASTGDFRSLGRQLTLNTPVSFGRLQTSDGKTGRLKRCQALDGKGLHSLDSAGAAPSEVSSVHGHEKTRFLNDFSQLVHEDRLVQRSQRGLIVQTVPQFHVKDRQQRVQPID